MKMVNNNDTHRCEEWSHNLILRWNQNPHVQSKYKHLNKYKHHD
jgi:hypothetical protein